jgi:hypothetical protein
MKADNPQCHSICDGVYSSLLKLCIPSLPPARIAHPMKKKLQFAACVEGCGTGVGGRGPIASNPGPAAAPQHEERRKDSGPNWLGKGYTKL